VAGDVVANFLNALTVPAWGALTAEALVRSATERVTDDNRSLCCQAVHISNICEVENGGARQGSSRQQGLFPFQVYVVGWVFSLSLNTEDYA